MSLQLIAIIEHLFILLLHIFFLLIKFGLLFFILLHFFGRWAVIFYRYFSFSIFNECIYCNYWVLIPKIISSILGLVKDVKNYLASYNWGSLDFIEFWSSADKVMKPPIFSPLSKYSRSSRCFVKQSMWCQRSYGPYILALVDSYSFFPARGTP